MKWFSVHSCKHPVPFSPFIIYAHKQFSPALEILLLFAFVWFFMSLFVYCDVYLLWCLFTVMFIYCDVYLLWCLFTVMFLDWWACLEVIQCFCFMKCWLLGTSVGKWDMMGYWTAVVSIKQLIFFLILSNGLCWCRSRETKAYLWQLICMFYVDIGHTEWELVFNAQSSMMIISIRLI